MKRIDSKLISTIKSKNIDNIKILIDQGANINCIDKDDLSPLYYAVEQSWVEGIRSLVKYNADINAKNYRGETHLHQACINNDPQATQCLLELGADYISACNNGKIAFEFAEGETRSIFESYLEKEGSLQAVTQIIDNSNLNRALQKASIAGDIESIKQTIAQGADIETLIGACYTPLLYASAGGHLECIQYLISKGANINAKSTDNGESILDLALKAKRFDLSYLIENGANVNFQDNNGYTLLHSAVFNENINIVIFLMESGADHTLKDRFGRTASDIARDKRNYDISTYIDSYHAQVENKILNDYINNDRETNTIQF